MKRFRMSPPVTRGYLRSELSKVRQEISGLDDKLDGLEQRLDGKLDSLEQKMDLWGGALKAHFDAAITQHVDAAVTRLHFDAAVTRLSDELRRHVTASNEQHRTEIAALDDKYKDLPARVARLETDR